ncbi:DNA polymerase IV [Rhodococcus hoagii]|jgi:DNA polymerase-4|uniref:DNA polymerase IV n=1 Tax=Rhodococcus hoagii TaxID=43767 RepID=A0A9Q4ZJB6_RHOHA|nr:DNA polymerase IV [Prescottella equi]MBM4488907.1 DNA polymerase IV [Prescottella equi]MBM4498730.1 DNA polymerase IV [Prescottella equi]MBM4503496.1 DNA polymerase IV [Prescottella equi]MBM4509112.1 DNA polymerase IV [Prescottella equi]MBM4537462.1 DNA polymerase IV [Prescottella equi]
MVSADPTRSRRWVLHLDMDAFFASVEQLTRPTLRGRPVLVGGLGGRGVVAGASYEARVFGAHSAMPMHQARRLVGPAAVVLPPRGSLYGHVSRQVFDALRVRMPVLEQLSMDEAFGEPAELAGVGKAEVERYCEELRALVLAETGLVASIGAGAGKQVAKIASGLAKPNGVTVVSPDVQQQLMSALPVRKLWGVGPVAEEKLKRLGIDTIGALAALPDAEVVSVLGGTIGPSLHRLARGIDDRPVAERADAKQVSAETTYAEDIVTLAGLRRAVDASAAAAHRRLDRDGRAARTVVLKLRKSDMSIVTRSLTLPYATTDLQILTATAQRQVIDPLELGPIRLVGVGFGGLSAVSQGSLFPELDQAVPAEDDVAEADAIAEDGSDTTVRWRPGMDVSHPEYGHGWVQGAGHGVVTVRFETRSTGRGPSRTFDDTDCDLVVADVIDSLA